MQFCEFEPELLIFSSFVSSQDRRKKIAYFWSLLDNEELILVVSDGKFGMIL